MGVQTIGVFKGELSFDGPYDGIRDDRGACAYALGVRTLVGQYREA